MLVVGADGCRRGWVAVTLEDGRFVGAVTVPTIAAALERHPRARAVGVDMPMGLPAGRREADQAAREFVGALRSSVFPTPPRAVLEAASHRDAVAVCRRMGLPGVSQQAFALRTKILEVDQLAAGDQRVIEVHPEVSFAELAGGPLHHSKHTWNGLMARLALLEEAGIELPDELPASVPATDLVDAAAAAWSADRYARGRAEPLPEAATHRLGTIWR